VEIKKIIRETKFQINENKTRFLSKKGKMIVTGIVLNSDKLSIGRNAKKKLRSQIYNYYMGNDKSNGNQISGMLSYLNSIEPNTLESYKQYIEKLRNKLNQKT